MQDKRDYNNKSNPHGIWITHYDEKHLGVLSWKAYFVDGKTLGLFQANHYDGEVAKKSYYAK